VWPAWIGPEYNLQADVTRGFLWLASIHLICTPGELSKLVKLAFAFLEWNYADLTPRIVRRESVVLSAPNGDCPHHWLEVSCDGTSIITMNGYMDVAALDDADWWIKWVFERWLGAKRWTDSPGCERESQYGFQRPMVIGETIGWKCPATELPKTRSVLSWAALCQMRLLQRPNETEF